MEGALPHFASLSMAYICFGFFVALHEDSISIGQITFLFVASAIGPFLAVFSVWYALAGILSFSVLFYFASRRLQRIKRLLVLFLLFLGWVFFGSICFTVATGGA